MSLRQKIVLSFFISAFIVAILMVFEYINFIKIKNEIMYLEITDTIRSKSLQLRRHEKNFFLYKDVKELKSVYNYLEELKGILQQSRQFDNTDNLIGLQNKVEEYSRVFNRINAITQDVQKELAHLKSSHAQYPEFLPIIESTFMESPLVNADLLEKIFLLKPDNPTILNLQKLNTEITALRRNGEDIIIISKEVDRIAKDNVDGLIHRSQIALFVFFLLFVIVGIGTFLFIINGVVKRLKVLTDLVEKTGTGYFSKMFVTPRNWTGIDEVGILIQKFNTMEEQLSQREKELLQSKKLAAIGTLASGVAHELNNPLNNIYTTAQRLIKKTGEECPSFVKKGLNDIFDQTMRVKRIVGDLLEFSSGREPQFKETELNNLITGAYRHIANSIDVKNINFMLDSDSKGIMIYADPEQMEQVFINLFTNAVDVMSGKGDLMVKVTTDDAAVKIEVSDTGTGMSRETIEKIFEPFFTTKDRGTGLGLAIVFNIIQKHNGNISVESEEGKGTTFIITLTLPKGNI